jgi:WD40 repeat protein
LSESNATDDKTLTAPPPSAVEPHVGVLPIVERDVYVRGAQIAAGGMGRIIEARDTRLDRVVALKELLEPDVRLAARFEREVLISARLEHPAIVAVYEAGRWPNAEPFYAMKRVVGRALDKVIEERRTIAERLALIPNVLAVFDALAYAHGKQIIHRDLKPANILIGEHGETVVIDWGLAKDLGTDDDDPVPERVRDSAHTIVGAVLGTPAYMAPEQARGEIVDERADVYALGALLYYVLAGTAPYAGESAEQILTAVKDGGALVVRRPGVPDDLATIVETAMARDPAHRYPTARELAEDLRRFQTGQLVGRHAYSLRALLWRWIRRHRAVVAVAVGMLVLSGVALKLAFDQIAEERDRAEDDEAWERVKESEQIVARAKGLLDSDPAAALDVLREIPLDAPEPIRRDAWLAAVATTGTLPAREVRLSPDGSYAAVFVMADGSVLGLRDHPVPPTQRLHPPISIDRFAGGAWKTLAFELHDLDPVSSADRAWLVWREGSRTQAWNIHDAAPRTFDLAADTIAAGDGSTVTLRGPSGCHVVELATAAIAPCPPIATVTFDNATHTLTAIGPDGARHTRELPANVSDQNVLGDEPTLRIAPDGRSFVIGIGSFVDPVTVVGDIELEHVTTIPSRLIAAKFVSNGDAFVVTRNGSLYVKPGSTTPIRMGARGFDVTAASITGDGRWAVTTSRHEITLWNVRAFSATRLAGTQPGEIYSVAIAPDGRSVVTCANDRTLRIWELERDGPDRLALGSDPDGFAVFGDRAIVTVETATGHTLIAWTPGGAPVKIDVPHAPNGDVQWATTTGTSPPIAASGDRVAAMMGGTLQLVDLSTGTHAQLDVDGYPSRLAFSPDGKQLLAVDSKLQVWDVATHALDEPKGTNAAWRGDGKLVTMDRTAVYVDGSKLRIDDVHAPVPIFACKPSAIDARGATIAIGCTDGMVRVLTPGAPGRLLMPFAPVLTTPISVLSISESGIVAAGNSRPGAFAWQPHEQFSVMLYGETRAVSYLHWAGDVLESATPSDSWIWDLEQANGGAKLPSDAKILLGAHYAFVANDGEHVVRATLLPPRPMIGFAAWLVARSR